MNTVTESPQPPCVHVVDDDDGFRNGMTRMLRAAGWQVAGYRCAGEFLIANPDDAPGCILLDISMPGPSGVELLKALVSRPCAPPVIFVTGWDDVLTSVDVMKSGAVDYLVKPIGADRILPVVRKAIRLDAQQRAARQELSELHSRFALLTAAERTIFQGVVRNKLNKQLAAQLGSCERTIKAQRARMMEKLQLTSLPELVRAAKLLEGESDENGRHRDRPGQERRPACASPLQTSERIAAQPMGRHACG